MGEANGRLIEQLDRQVGPWHLLQHPFYQAWTAGTLERGALQLYAAQYYRHVEAFPAYLRGLAARADGGGGRESPQKKSMACGASTASASRRDSPTSPCTKKPTCATAPPGGAGSRRSPRGRTGRRRPPPEKSCARPGARAAGARR